MPERFALELLAGGDVAERRVPLEGSRATIGRKPGNALVLADTHVSGVHAEVVQEGGRWVLRDLGSTNGTFLEGRKVEEVTLSVGDEFLVGQTRIRLVDLDAPEAPRRLEAPPKERRSLVLPLALLLVLGAAAAAYFKFGGSPGGDATLPVAAVPGNLVKAASFEALEGEEPGKFWRSGEGTATFSPGREGRRSGAGGATATFAGPGLARLEYAEEIPVDDARAYVLALHARGEGPALALRVAFTSSQDAEVAAVRGGDFVEPSREFGRVEARVVPPPGCDRARPFVVAAGSRGSVSIDDVEMRASDAAKAERIAVRDVACAFDPLGASLRRIREPWLRGLRVAFAGPGGTVDAADALSPGTGEVRFPEGKAGALTAAAAPAKEGIAVRYSFEAAGALAARPALVFEIHPDYLAQAGLSVLGPPGAPEYAGDFREEGATGLVLGEGTGRLRVGFDPPLAVTGRAGAGGFLEIEAPFEKAVAVFLQVSFEEERRRALDLVREAEAAGTARPAEAIAKYAEVVSKFPFEKESLARAREERARLLREGLERVAALQKEAEEARFFRIPGAFRAAKESCGRIAEAYRGTEVGDRAAGLLAGIEEDARAVEAAIAARERERRERVASELEGLGMKKLAALVREGK